MDDDARAPLAPGHALHPMALLAWRHQDDWSAAEHRRFMAEIVRVWPKQSGRRPVIETTAWWAGELRAAGMTDEEVAAALVCDPDTLRRYRVRDRREMALHEQVEVDPQGDALGRPPLPRVYADGDDEPARGWVNLPLATLARARPREAVAVEWRAREALRHARG